MIGQVFLTNDTAFVENEVAVIDDLISNICLKGELSQ